MWPLISPASSACVSFILALINEWPVFHIMGLPPRAFRSSYINCEHLTSPMKVAPGFRRRARFRALEDAQGGRALLGLRDRSGAPRLAHRVLRDGDQVSGGDPGYPRGRRRPDLPAPRKRDRAIGIADRQTVFALLAPRRVPHGGGAENVQVAGQLLY